MSTWQSLKWINGHGAACVVLALLLLGCLALHHMAFATVTIFSDIPHLTWPPRVLRSMAGVQFFQANWWFALPHLLLFFGALIYMEVRGSPRWAVWCTFLFMSLPIFAYASVCLRLFTGFFTPVGPFYGS